ncbi:MAG: type II secretion system F family protein [Planctomycetaceae bacterium]
MLFNPQISAKALYPFCQSMARMLEAGVEIPKSLKTSAARSSDSRLTAAVDRVITRVKRGDDLTSSFYEHEERFPALFLDLLNVGEQTGSMPEIFGSLGKYYEARVDRVREFRTAIAWPMIQLFAAICVIGLLIWLLGIVGTGNTDVLGFGLLGARGATIWFALCFGSLGGLWISYKMFSRTIVGQQVLDPLLLRIPVVGKCLRSFAIARFAWCFALTQQAGMSIKPSLESSLKATANGAFVAAIPIVWNEVHEGETLADAFAAPKLFPTEFLQFVETAEQTGTVPEALDRMSHHFDAEAHRAMILLSAFLARMVWGLVAVVIIFFIFRIAMFYVGMINSAARDALNVGI